ncbi:hypothetical protein AMAG_18702 [Allomyces macrogynus ATCC 38327]|uniref:Amino acid permease/ SLC12A domain-containing protein n=1 Tax=Allomyces macrogynus (strain ATCC 38327) TaxID=578462 RepID=A0A0L0SEA7_ALLM3|nr:hypothetical protein AMAG_18702 [Allomyces macrogynus ATCC 38327]|eukprot:KNE60873.1 hypothetical protein AMAG_18702 [Allomyces macrogynus ATCC 38327]
MIWNPPTTTVDATQIQGQYQSVNATATGHHGANVSAVQAQGQAQTVHASGVTIPTCEFMWSVLIFVRFGHIVGEAGLLAGLALLLLCAGTVAITATSVAAIATNGLPRDGVVQVMTRVLGSGIGGTITLIFGLGVAIFSSVEVVGSVQGLLEASGWQITSSVETDQRILSVACLAFLGFVAFLGHKAVYRLALVFLVALIVAYSSCFAGFAMAPRVNDFGGLGQIGLQKASITTGHTTTGHTNATDVSLKQFAAQGQKINVSTHGHHGAEVSASQGQIGLQKASITTGHTTTGHTNATDVSLKQFAAQGQKINVSTHGHHGAEVSASQGQIGLQKASITTGHTTTGHTNATDVSLKQFAAQGQKINVSTHGHHGAEVSASEGQIAARACTSVSQAQAQAQSQSIDVSAATIGHNVDVLASQIQAQAQSIGASVHHGADVLASQAQFQTQSINASGHGHGSVDVSAVQAQVQGQNIDVHSTTICHPPTFC